LIHHALARHLPFVAAFKRFDNVPRLHQIAEWVGSGDALDFRPLLVYDDKSAGWRAENAATRPL
jgi:hypothetical protein